MFLFPNILIAIAALHARLGSVRNELPRSEKMTANQIKDARDTAWDAAGAAGAAWAAARAAGADWAAAWAARDAA